MSAGGGRITNRAGRDRPRFIRPVERQRMRPWLEEHLDKNDIPGLNWVNVKERIFRIAWKHAANQCFNLQKDTNLFERWAIHTGRHYDSDHKRWKANFRCALNSLPDVKENKEQGIKKGNNAFKVYKFLDERETRGIRESKVKKNKDYEGEMAMKMTDDGDDVYDAVGDISVDDGEESASMQSIPKLDQLYPSSGVEMLLEAGTKEKVEPLTDTAEDTNLQEILAAATASVAAGSDPATLENISIDQLKRLGEVSRMRLDVRQSTKKSTSGYMYVFLCRWCEKVFPRKIELFQHFLITHQDKLLAGEEYGDQSTQNDPKHQKLLEEIEDLEQKVLGLHENTYTSSETESEDVHEDDKTCREAVTNESEEKALDLTMSHKGQKSSPKQETALDLSMSTGKRHRSTSKHTVKRRRSSQDSDVNYSIKFGNYGIAGTPRTKRQLSLHSRRMEEEQERLAKKLPNTDSPDTADTSRQHSVEDIVHAEMLLALKTGNEEGSEKGSSKSQTVKGGNNGKAGKRGKTTVKKSRKPVNTLQTDKKLIGKDSSVTEGEAYTKDRSGAKSNKAFAMRAFKCGLCLSKFTTSKSLLEHVKSHQGTFLHKCRNCGTQCDSQKDLIQHISSTHPNYPHRCDFCGKFCKTVKKLKNHMWSHIRVCQLCGEKFYNTDLFDIHLREIHDVRKGTETADQPEADSVELAALDIHNDVKMESDDSDENVDEEEREEDKDSNATTEFAEDSDEDPDNSDGVRVTDPTEDAAEGHGEDELNEDNGTGENDPRDQSSDGTGHNTDTVKDAQEDNSSKLENELEIKEEEVKFVDTAEKTGEENTSNDEIMMDTNTKVECREMDLVKDYAKNVKEKSDGIPVIKEGESVMLEETKHEVKLEKDLHERDECSDSGSKILGHGQPSAANVDNKFDPVEDMSDNISSPSQSSDKTQIIIKVSDTEKKMVYPESAVYKTKAKHLKRIMGTAYNGTCLVCNKTVPMNFIAKHIKSHSVITLIKAKEALDMLGIKIHALEHPLFVCNLCNMGFDSCSSLSTHVSKHVSQHLVPTTGNKPNPSHPREGIKKRKGDEAMHSDSKAKCSKTVQSKTVQSTSSVYVGKPHAANLPSSSNQTKGTGARTVNSAGSILAAYLNAGPMYQTSSLATIFKLTNDSSQVDMVSARDPTDVGPTGRDLNEHAVSNPNTFQHGAAQEKEIENMVAGAKQRAAFNPNPGAVLFPREGKEPAKPIPLMFIKGDSKQDLKLIPASSLTLPRGGQVLKVIPQGLLHDQPGTDLQGRAPGGGPDNSSTMVTTTYDQSVGAISSIGPTCPTLSISSPLTRNMTTQSTDDGQTIDQSSRSVYGVDKPVSVASQDIVSRLSGATEMKLAVSPNHNTPVSLSKSISNIGSGDTGSKESAGTTTIMSTLPASISHGQNLPVSLQPGHSLPVTLQPGQNLPVTLQPKQNLPISLQFGQNLPVTLQPRQNLPVSLQLGQNLPASLPSRHNVSTGLHSGQVQFVSPVGANQSSGRQLTILKCPLGVNVIRYSNSPSIAEQTQAPGAQLQLQQAHLSEETPKAMVSKTSIPRITFTESGTNTLPVDSVSAKQSSPAAVVSARTIPVAPQLSVVNDPATSTNIMLSQYLQNQGVVSTSGNDIVTSNMHSNAKTLPADQPHVKGTAKKPTFNLVITQSPLTHPALGSPAVISGSGLPLTLGRGSLHDSTLISSSTSTAGNTTTTTTNRLALICNLCTTEIQNLEMISRHVCTSRPSTTSPVVATGGTPVRESVIFPCVSCNREFNDLEILLLHQRCHNVADVTAPLFACQLCSKVYKTDVTYAAHIDTCHGNRVLSCPLCHRVFPDQTRCAEHIQTDHSAQTKCDLCPIGDTKLYLTSTDLHLHRMFEHPFECAHCDSRFNNVDQIWDHVSNHSIVKTSKKPPPPSTLQGHDQGGVICRKCLVGFVSLQTFQTHVRIQHPGDKFYTLMEENPAKCPLCECSYKHKKTLNHHVLNVHVRKVNYSCSVCGLVCVTPGHLASHLKEHWSQTQPAASEFEIVFCHPCQMVFPSRSLHTQHLQTNCEADKESKTNTVPTSDTTGSTIDKTFGNEPVMQLKMDKHEVMDGKPITISSTFGSIVSPDVTTASDAVVKGRDGAVKGRDAVVKGRDGAVSEYLCELCGMEGFKSKFLLKQHRVIRHLRPHPRASPSYYQHVIDNLKRPKSYDCIVCGKKFDASSVLKLHMKSHLRHIKPNFVCSFRGCRAKFTTRLSCLNHIKTCSFKNNRADQELDYYNGAREVADKSAVSCKTCFIMFNTRNGLKRHLMRKHPGEVTKCTYCGEMCSHATFDDHSQTCTGTN